MLIRTITGAIIAILTYLWLFFSHIPVVLYAGMIILCVLALFEVYRICQTDKPHMIYISLIVSLALLILPFPSYEYVLMLVLPIAILAFVAMMQFMDKIERLRGE